MSGDQAPSLCLDLGGTAAKVGLLRGGRVLAATEFPVSGQRDDLASIRTTVAALRAAHDLSGPLRGVGLALPGVVDRERGTLVAAHGKYPYAIGMDLRAWAQELFGAPAAIENDARAALLGETTYGVVGGEKDAVLVTIGTGIGTAVMMDGHLVRGAHDHAGILGGHVTVDLAGPPCNCGNVGCAEALASTWALERSIRAHREFGESASWRLRLAARPVGIRDLLSDPSDVIAREVIERFVRVWGAAIVTLCHAYDPATVVVTGGVMRSADRILPQLTRYVAAHLWSSMPRPRIVVPERPDLSVLLGLSVLADSLPSTP